MSEKQILKVYGPYISKKDQRKRVIIRYTDKTMSVKSYARFLYEQNNGTIDKSFTVDHIDENYTNDNIVNLQLLTREENIKKSWKLGTHKSKEWYEGWCQVCGAFFIKPFNYVKHNRKFGRAGPFCSRKCAGIYSKNVQTNRPT